MKVLLWLLSYIFHSSAFHRFLLSIGILDPLELNLITGININPANTYVGGLPTITEEGNSSFSSHLRSRNESSEKPPLKDLNDKRLTTLKEYNSDKPSCSVGNHDSLPHHKVPSLVPCCHSYLDLFHLSVVSIHALFAVFQIYCSQVTNKVLSINQNIHRSGSKVDGCLKTLAASSSYPFCAKQYENFTFTKMTQLGLNFDILLIISLNSCTLKRPANSNTLKTAKKEAKLPKLPISKRQSCFSATTKGSLAPNQLRHNMIPKPSKCWSILEHVSIPGDWSNTNLLGAWVCLSFLFFFLQLQMFRRTLSWKAP